ncbi:MAG: hypothetical protein VYC34_11050, partial [Planctomycetota bacterium]|nr:hypothetical protein [Planctomycetota bacterium]
MKLKGINPLEQHVEKIVFAIALVALLAVFSLQFIGEGNTVKVNQAEVPVADAYEQVAAEANRVLGRINDPSPDPQVPTTVPDLSVVYQDRLVARVSPEPLLPAPLGPAPDGGPILPDPNVGASLAIEMPTLPAPRNPVAVTYAGAIDPLVVAANPKLAEIAPSLPVEQPYDLRGVSVEATFDISSFIDGLAADPDGSGPKIAIPVLWWQNRLAILDVELIRQEIYDDGALGPEQLIPLLPGRANFRDQFAAISTRADLQRIVEQAQQMTPNVITPRFYHVISGEPWTPPSLVAEGAAANTELERLKRQYRSIERLIEDQRERLKNIEGSGRRSSRNAAPLDGVRAQVSPGGGRGGQREQEPTDSGPSAAERQRTAIQGRIDELTAQMSTLAARLKELGFDVTRGQRLVDPVQEAISQPIGRLRDKPTLRVWAHDVTAAPGAN